MHHVLISAALFTLSSSQLMLYSAFAFHVCVFFGSSSQITLKESLDECMEALDLFLNNHFSESLEKLRPR